MMTGRVHRMVMPGRGVRRVVTPALGEALMTGGDGRIRDPAGDRGGTSARGGAGGCRADRVVGLVVGCGAGCCSGSSGCRGRRPKAQRAGFPVVPGGAGSGGGIGRQIVIGRGIVSPVGLVMIQGISGRGRGGRVVRFLGMMGAVTPAALRASGGRVGMTNDARWSSGGRRGGIDTADFPVGGSGRRCGQPLGGYVERSRTAVARHRGGARRGRTGAGCWCRWHGGRRRSWCSR